MLPSPEQVPGDISGQGGGRGLRTGYQVDVSVWTPWDFHIRECVLITYRDSSGHEIFLRCHAVGTRRHEDSLCRQTAI